MKEITFFKYEDVLKEAAEKLGCKTEVLDKIIQYNIRYIKDVLVKDPKVATIRLPHIGLLHYNVKMGLSLTYKNKWYEEKGIQPNKFVLEELRILPERKKMLEDFWRERVASGYKRKKFAHFRQRLRTDPKVNGNKYLREMEETQKEVFDEHYRKQEQIRI